MKIILCCLSLLVIGIVVLLTKPMKNIINIDLLCFILIIIASVLLFTSLISIPIERIQTYSEIEQFKNVQQTILNIKRNDFCFTENLAIQLKIIEKNEWLASMKYYKNTVFSLWIPGEINNLSEIK